MSSYVFTLTNNNNNKNVLKLFLLLSHPYIVVDVLKYCDKIMFKNDFQLLI